MKKYAFRRLLQLIPILFAITFLSYGMMRIAGSDVVTQKMENTGQILSEDKLNAAREQLGLDKPFLTQYFVWLGKLLHGREKALHALDAEIPHGIAVAIDRMKTRPGKNPIVDIDATIICERESHKGIIIGKQGAMLKKIGSNARYEIERMLESKVNLKLWVKVKKDWRDSDFLIKNFGYDKKEI